MSTIAVVAALISQCQSRSALAEIWPVRLAETVTKGQVGYQTTTGTYGLCDTGEVAKDEPRGIFLEPGVAGMVVDLIKYGPIYGVTLTAINCDVQVYASNTAGGLSDSAVDEVVGRVVALTDPDKTKVLFVDCRGTDKN